MVGNERFDTIIADIVAAVGDDSGDVGMCKIFLAFGTFLFGLHSILSVFDYKDIVSIFQ